jgi:hypothetical protein
MVSAGALPAQRGEPNTDCGGNHAAVRVATGGATPACGFVERVTRDSIYVRASGVLFPLARTDITRLDTLVRRDSASAVRAKDVGDVINAGLATTGVLVVVGVLPCLAGSPPPRDGRLDLPCYILAPAFGTAGLVGTAIFAVLTAITPTKAMDRWAPVPPATYGLALSDATRGHPPIARPVVGWRVAF